MRFEEGWHVLKMFKFDFTLLVAGMIKVNTTASDKKLLLEKKISFSGLKMASTFWLL